MKHAIAYLVCILAGIEIGWHFGHARAVIEYERDVLPKIEAQMEDLNRQRAEEFNAAKPWEESTASIALAAEKKIGRKEERLKEKKDC